MWTLIIRQWDEKELEFQNVKFKSDDVGLMTKLHDQLVYIADGGEADTIISMEYEPNKKTSALPGV